MGWELEPSKAKDHSQVRGTERGRRHLRHRWSWEGVGGSPMLCSSHLRPGQLLKPGEALSVPLSDSLVISTPSGSPVLIACFPPRVHAREQAGGLHR